MARRPTATAIFRLRLVVASAAQPRSASVPEVGTVRTKAFDVVPETYVPAKVFPSADRDVRVLTFHSVGSGNPIPAKYTPGVCQPEVGVQI
jgi:hypothetical protein